MKLLAILLTGLIFIAMPFTDDKLIELNREFELGLKTSGNLKSECLKISFESVLEDSRCPTGVNCIWAGNAVVRVKISKNGQDEKELDLNTGIEPLRRSYQGYEISLKRLSPYPKEGSEISAGEYKAVLLIKEETEKSQHNIDEIESISR